MSKYYIYKQFSNIDSHHYTRDTGDTVAYTDVIDPATGKTIKSYDFCILSGSYWRYSLSKNKGEFYGVGNFCGYYGYSCWRGCEIIADELYDVDSEGEVSVVFVEYEEPITYDVHDTYSMPRVIECDTDEEAIKYYVDWCEKEFNREKEID